MSDYFKWKELDKVDDNQPFGPKKIKDELKNSTNNWTLEKGKFSYGYEEEVKLAQKYLSQKGYDAEWNYIDGRFGPQYTIFFSKGKLPDNYESDQSWLTEGKKKKKHAFGWFQTFPNPEDSVKFFNHVMGNDKNENSSEEAAPAEGGDGEAIAEELVYGLYFNDKKEPIETGSKKDMMERKKELQKISPEDSYHRPNKYTVKKIGETSWESLQEDFERISKEDEEWLDKRIEEHGFKVVSKRDYGHFDEKDVHYQIISNEGNKTKEDLDKEADWIDDLLDEFEDATGSPCTYNMGLQDDGYISCGFDCRSIYYKPGEDTFHKAGTKLRFKNGKPADNATRAELDSIGKHFGMEDGEIDAWVPVDHSKKESLKESYRIKLPDGSFFKSEVLADNPVIFDSKEEAEDFINKNYNRIEFKDGYEIISEKLNEVWTNGSGPGYYETIDYIKRDLEESEIKFIEDNFDGVTYIEVSEEDGQRADEIICNWVGENYSRNQGKGELGDNSYEFIITDKFLYDESLKKDTKSSEFRKATAKVWKNKINDRVNNYHWTEEQAINELVKDMMADPDEYQEPTEERERERLTKLVKNTLALLDKDESLNEEWQYCNCKDLDEVAKLSDYCIKNGCKITAKTSTNDGYKCRIEGPFDDVHKVNDKWSMFKWKGTPLEEDIEIRPGSTTIVQKYKEFDSKQEAENFIISEEGFGEMNIRYIPKTKKYRVVWEEIDESINEDIEKHDTLNPVIFDGEELKPEVKEAIQRVVDTFVEELSEDNINFTIKDIVLIGSNASYNYTKDSDLDIHLVVDSSSLECPNDLQDKLYGAYRSIFNKNYDINIKGIPLELFVELDELKGKSNGVYSLNTGWIKKPEQQDIPELDKEAFDKLFKEWEDRYNSLLNKGSENSVLEEAKVNSISIYYPKLTITVQHQTKPETFNSSVGGMGGWSPAESEEEEIDVDYELEVSSDEVIDALFDELGNEDKFKDLSDENLLNYIDEHVEDLSEEYEDYLRKYFEDIAIEKAQEKYYNENEGE